MHSLALCTLRTASQPKILQATLMAASMGKTRSVIRAYSTQGPVPDLPETTAELKEMIARLNTSAAEQQAKAKEAHEKYLLALAEMENVRLRTRKEVESAKQFGIQKFSKDLLGVIDVLNMAIKSVPAEEAIKEENSHLKNLYDGVVMTEKEVMKVFQRNGLQRFDPTGEKFDPNQHEALFEIPDASKPHGTVGVVQKVGYSLNGRTLRPAQVGVVKAR